MRTTHVKENDWRIIILVVSFIVLAAIVTDANAGGDNKPVSPMEIDKLDKQKAPEFSLKDFNGKNIALSSFRGKVVLLNFWATWCPPCLEEMPAFKKLYGEMRSRGLEIVAVSTDRSAHETRSFTDNKGFDFTILMDENRAVTKEYKVFSLPTTFLIDRNGAIVEKFFGEHEWAGPEMKKKIEKLL